ncbi:hypothetical protein [Nocardioides nematodiphilus]|uniref:hypothetical protein n=1 Tax=Nocardioides nematodiphilus TaxID=2849669 RepID=UPI001CDA2FF6|nr:hypothetical protein [Nocardioides nematodiphilus]MCA1982709.1 hypothetical protein [Nocardioides nematodiphilus]
MVHPGSTPWPSYGTSLQVPAHPDFVAAIRAMTRSMAVLADVSLEDAEDLQMAVDEAAILLLPLVDDSVAPALSVEFELGADGVVVRLSAACRPGAEVDRSGMPWAMLVAIDPATAVQSQDGRVAIEISRRREDQLR